MFRIPYSTWVEVCGLYFKENTYRLKASLQWYPFSKDSMDASLHYPEVGRDCPHRRIGAAKSFAYR